MERARVGERRREVHIHVPRVIPIFYQLWDRYVLAGQEEEERRTSSIDRVNF
jgi:hypothetical protein